MIQKDLLLTFDFDQTIINHDSDEAMITLHPQPTALPLLTDFETQCDYMNKIFEVLHSSGIKKHDILTILESLSITEGFENLLKFVSNLNADLIIISDSNRFFIEHFLKHHNLTHHFSGLFTNHGDFDHREVLRLDYHHRQDWCILSNANLCKGYVLESFMNRKQKEGVSYKKVAYVGDGRNDYCPSLRLSSNDLIFARKSYDLEFVLTNDPSKVKAQIVSWKNGFEIIEKLKFL